MTRRHIPCPASTPDLASADQEDRGLRFDSVRHPLPGAGTYRWVERVRQPSYLRVQGPQ